MITSIKNIIGIFKQKKGEIDQEQRRMAEEMSKTYSQEYYIEQVRPNLVKRYTEKVAGLKAATLQAVENELVKVERKVSYMVGNINKERLAEIEAIRGMTLSPYMEKVLLEKYAGDPWSTSKIMDIINEGRQDTEKLSFVHPEEFLRVAAELKAEVAFILNNYTEYEETARPETAKTMIQIELIEKNLDSYIDRFSTDYMIESDLDAPIPLSDHEKYIINGIFSGCVFDHEKRDRARKAVQNGQGELVSRSEFRQYLPGDFEPIIALSKEGEKLIGGDISPAQYAGIEEIYMQGDDIANFSAIMGMGAENAQETPTERKAQE